MTTIDRDAGGFTLIELLIVIVILGILATIALPKLDYTRKQGYRSALKADLKNIAVQQDLYYMENNYTYTSSLADLSFNTSTGVAVSFTEADAEGWAATAVHSGLDADDGCAIFFGEATPPSTPGGTALQNPGVVVCDEQ